MSGEGWFAGEGSSKGIRRGDSMDLRDITNEQSLLKSYKTVFVDNQTYELIKIYRDRKGTFPIFLDRVFATTGPTAVDLLAYRTREKVDENNVGRIFIFERTDNSADLSKTRLFWVWVSPKLIEQLKNTLDAAVNASVLFHPLAGLEKYPKYWSGDVDPVKFPNYLELGGRYLCKEKHTVTQHLCALRPVRAPGKKIELDVPTSPLVAMVVVPVSNVGSYFNLANPAELEDALKQIARRCREKITGVVSADPPTIGRVAVSAYSRSGVLLRSLMDNTRLNEPFMRKTLREVYAFDVMLDERDRSGNVIKTKQQGYDELWAKLKTWQGDDADRKIRLYSAEPATVSNVYSELGSRLKKYGGGYHNSAVPFSSFNGKTVPGGSTKHANLVDGYEIYSTDNSRSLVVLPFSNPLVYLSSENIKNPAGFGPGGDYEPNLEGHNWFVSRLQSHALFHSGF